MVDIKYQPQLVFSPDFWLPWHGPVQDTSTEAFGSDVAFWSGGFHHRIFFWGKKVETSIFKTTQNFGMGRTFFVLSRLKCPQWILMAGTLRRHKDRRILELNSYQWPVIVDKKKSSQWFHLQKNQLGWFLNKKWYEQFVIVCDMFEQIEMWSCSFCENSGLSEAPRQLV